MINLRSGRQSYDFDCGATALQVVMEYFGVEVRGDRLRRALKTGQDGTHFENMIAYARKKGFEVFAAEGTSLEQVRQFIDAGYPVIVLVQAWAERYMTLDEWKEDLEDGHYVVIIGYQGDIIIFEDPASPRHTWLTTGEFLARWHDVDPKTGRRVQNFAMVLMGKPPAARAPHHMD